MQQVQTPPHIARALSLGLLLLIAAVGIWFYADSHAPTVSTALKGYDVLKPRAYDLLRFTSAALAILGVASLIRAILSALLANQAATSGPAPVVAVATSDESAGGGTVEVTPTAAEDPGKSSRSLWTAGLLVFAGPLIAIAAVVVVGSFSGSSPSQAAAPPPAATAESESPAVETFPETPVDEGDTGVSQEEPAATLTGGTEVPTSQAASLSAAESMVQDKGYTPYLSTGYLEPGGLRVVLGSQTGSADSGLDQAFFFHGSHYLGTDAADPSNDIGLASSDRSTIALKYRLYRAADPRCCSTGGGKVVRFHWNGSELKPLDTIPSADPQASVYR